MPSQKAAEKRFPWAWFAIVGIYLALAIYLDSPFLFFHKTLFEGDVTYNIEPVIRYCRDVWLEKGFVPLWTPYVLCGAPLVQVVWPLCYWPGFVYLAAPFGIATGLFMLIHHLIAGIGGAVWFYWREKNTRSYVRLTGAFLFGLSYMLCGYMVGSTITVAIMATTSWIPLVLFSIDRMIASPRIWTLGALGFSLGMQSAAGRPELVAISFLLYFTYIAAQIFSEEAAFIPIRQKLKSLFLVFLSIAIGIALGTANILPLFEAIIEAPNVHTTSVLASTHWSAGWYDFLTMVLSQPFGQLGGILYEHYPTYPGDQSYITSFYLGPVFLTLAAFGLARPSWPLKWFWIIWCLAAAIFTAGEFTPVLPALMEHFNSLSLARFPVKLGIFMLLPLLVMAGQGWVCLNSKELDRRIPLAAAVLWLVLLVTGIAIQFSTDQMWMTIFKTMGTKVHEIKELEHGIINRLKFELVLAGLTGVLLSVCGFLSIKGRLSVKRAGAVWLAVGTISLVVNGQFQLWHATDESYYEGASGLARWLAKEAGPDNPDFRVVTVFPERIILAPAVYRAQRSQLLTVGSEYMRYIMLPNTNIDQRIQTLNGNSCLPTWGRFFLEAGLLPRSSLSELPYVPGGFTDLPLYRWCQATGTEFLLGFHYRLVNMGRDKKEVKQLNPDYFDLVMTDDMVNLRIYRISKVMPRFSLQANYKLLLRRYEAFWEMNRAEQTGYSPHKQVLISARYPEDEKELKDKLDRLSMEPGMFNDRGSIEVVSDTPHQIALKVKNEAPTFLVVRDTFYRGWIARDNGAPTKIFLADGNFRAILLEPGEHDILFSFEPASVKLGFLVSFLSLAFTLILICTAFWKRKSKEGKNV